MQAAIEWDNAEEMHVFIKDGDRAGRLDPLLSVRRQDLPRQPVRQARSGWIVCNGIARRFAVHESLTARFERAHLRGVVDCNARAIGITASHAMGETRARPHAREVRLSIRSSWNRLTGGE